MSSHTASLKSRRLAHFSSTTSLLSLLFLITTLLLVISLSPNECSATHQQQKQLNGEETNSIFSFLFSSTTQPKASSSNYLVSLLTKYWDQTVQFIRQIVDYLYKLFAQLMTLVSNLFHYVKMSVLNCSVGGLVGFVMNLFSTVYQSLLFYHHSLFKYFYSNHIRKYHDTATSIKNQKVEYYYWIGYCVIVTSILSSLFLFLIYNIYKVLKRRFDLLREAKTKEEKLRQQRITTLYEILVSERQYCEYLRFLHDQYYLPLEKGDTSKQLELNSSATSNLIQSIKETVAKSSLDLKINIKKLDETKEKSVEEGEEDGRNIVDFLSVHKYKKPEMLLIPHELENIIMLNNQFLRSLECEILGWHTKDRLMYNIYRYSVRIIGNIFGKGGAAEGSVESPTMDQSTSSISSPQTPTVLTKPSPLNQAFGKEGEKTVDNFGYNIKSVREKCNILDHCLREYMQAFVMYGMFICKYNECRTNINSLSKEFQLFSEQLKKARGLKGSNSLDLMSFIVMVPQRLPRYVLLLKQLGKCTNLNDPQFKEIENTVKELEKITFKVNSFVRDYQNQLLVITLKDTLCDLIPSFKSIETDFVQPTRRSVGSYKLRPIRAKEDSNNNNHAVDETPRSQQLQTVEVHLFNDVTIVVTSKPRVLIQKTKEENRFFNFFTPRNREKHNSMQLDQSPIENELIYEIYYCENSQISIFSQSHSSDCLIFELGKSKYFTNPVETKDTPNNNKEKKKESIQTTKLVSKIIHLDNTEEMTKIFVETFEKLSGQHKNTVFSMTEKEGGERLISNSKLLTLMASYINN